MGIKRMWRKTSFELIKRDVFTNDKKFIEKRMGNKSIIIIVLFFQRKNIYKAFSSCPYMFEHVFMFDPAVCDAPTRRLMEKVYPGQSKSYDFDQRSTAVMLEEIFNSPADHEKEVDPATRENYKEFYTFMKKNYNHKKDYNSVDLLVDEFKG